MTTIALLGGNRAEITDHGRLGFHAWILRADGTVVTDAWHACREWAESYARGFNAHFEQLHG